MSPTWKEALHTLVKGLPEEAIPDDKWGHVQLEAWSKKNIKEDKIYIDGVKLTFVEAGDGKHGKCVTCKYSETKIKTYCYILGVHLNIPTTDGQFGCSKWEAV